MDDLSGGAGPSQVDGWPMMHAFWLAIALLVGALGLVSGTAIGTHSGAEAAEEKIAAGCDQSGAFTVKRRGFSCERRGKE